MAGHPHFPRNIDKILSPKKKRVGVWERKPEAEIEFEQKKLRRSAYTLTTPSVAFLSVNFVLFLITYSFERWKFYHTFLIALLVFFGIYLLQFRNGRSFTKSPRFRICRDCLAEDWIGVNKCHCGGVLEPVEFYNFIEKSYKPSQKTNFG